MNAIKSNFKLIRITFLFFIFISIVSCGIAEDPRENKNNKDALEDIKTNFEGKVTEVIITEANVLYVSVNDNGVEQSRFAQTLCNVLKKHNATTKWVKIVKTNSAKDKNADNAYGVLLGEARCN